MSVTFGLTDVLMQPADAAVFHAYRASGTPSVVIVNPDGRIGTRIRSSQGIVEAAIRQALAAAPAAPPTPEDVAAKGSDLHDALRLDVTRWSGHGAKSI